MGTALLLLWMSLKTGRRLLSGLAAGVQRRRGISAVDAACSQAHKKRNVNGQEKGLFV